MVQQKVQAPIAELAAHEAASRGWQRVLCTGSVHVGAPDAGYRLRQIAIDAGAFGSWTKVASTPRGRRLLDQRRTARRPVQLAFSRLLVPVAPEVQLLLVCCGRYPALLRRVLQKMLLALPQALRQNPDTVSAVASKNCSCVFVPVANGRFSFAADVRSVGKERRSGAALAARTGNPGAGI